MLSINVKFSILNHNQSLTTMAKTITATKDGRTRTFNKATWDLLGESKDGWKAAGTKAPKETKSEKSEAPEKQEDTK